MIEWEELKDKHVEYIDREGKTRIGKVLKVNQKTLRLQSVPYDPWNIPAGWIKNVITKDSTRLDILGKPEFTAPTAYSKQLQKRRR